MLVDIEGKCRESYAKIERVKYERCEKKREDETRKMLFDEDEDEDGDDELNDIGLLMPRQRLYNKSFDSFRLPLTSV